MPPAALVETLQALRPRRMRSGILGAVRTGYFVDREPAVRRRSQFGQLQTVGVAAKVAQKRSYLPRIARVACPSAAGNREFMTAVRALGVQAKGIAVRGPNGFGPFLAAARMAGADAAVILAIRVYLRKIPPRYGLGTPRKLFA
jgi:hypothetical protein